MLSRVFEKVVSSVLTLALTIQPALLHAQNIQPVGPKTGPRPHVDQSLDGTTVINISTPNGAGVSHDVYTDFQADDLILNNSATITNTQLGGVIEGNGNLTPGQEANLWIGEVVGGNQTQLGGILEVAGQRMDVVVANEFGITCNGCGFINTGRATLTTGKPQFAGNGALTGFDVRRGTVKIGAGGLNPENRIGLTDTSRVDVIARAAAIYSKMRADQLNVVAGANQVDYNWSYDPETGAVTGITEQAGEGAAPALAVDVAALGGMYANAIRLIATENGVGVRLNGDMASSTNIALRADGQLTLGAPAGGHTPQIRAGGRVQVRNQGPILLEGAITSESGDLIDIRTSNGDLTFNGQAAGGAIRLESAGMLNISGAIVARNAFAAASTGSSVGLDGNSEVFAQSIDVNALTQLTFDGKAAALEAAMLTAGTELVTGADSELVAESVALNGDDVRIEGQAQALETLSVAATDGSVAHTGSSRGQFVTIAGDEIRTSAESQIAAVESLSVTAQDQAVIDGELVAGQQADLSVTAGDLGLQGQINARNTDVAVSGQTSLGADALLVGQSVLEFQSGSLNGGLNASHFDQLRAGEGLAVTLNTGGLSVGASEQVLFDGDLLLDLGGEIENRGTIKASGDLQLRSGSDLNNLGGLLKSGDTMQLLARDGTVLNQSGRIEADGGLAIEAETFDNRFDSIVTEPSPSGVEIFAGNPDNKTASRRVSTNPADLELESCFTSSRSNGGADRASSCATIYSFDGVFSNRGGVTWSTGTSVAASGAKPEILSGAGIAIQADTVRNDAGLISAEGGIDVQSSSFANNGYQDTRVTHTATYTRNLTIEINEGSGGSDAAFTTRTERVNYSPVSRETTNGATSETGQILAGGAVNISSTSVVANGDIRSGTSNVVAPPLDSSAVASAPLPELVVPGSSFAPVQPELQELVSLDTLIGEGRTSFGTTPVSYEDFISSDYFLDRLQIQDELFQNINRPAEWNGHPGEGTSYQGGDAVQGPGTGFNGFGDRFGLSESGLLTSLGKANTSDSGDLTIVAGQITGSGGSLIAENGSLSLTSFGNITFEDTELSGDLVDIITGGDFSGKALVIRSSSDTSIFAAGNVTIEGLAHTEAYYTNSSVTRITENWASRFETGSDLSIISSADMTLAGVQAQVVGDTRLTAGGNLYLLAEQSGVEYSEGDAKNGTDRLNLTAQITQLSAGGDFIANAGVDAILIGTQIDASGTAHLAAAGDVVLAATQDITQSETRKTSSGFLSKKKETRSTLAVTNRGVGITAGGDIDVIAETGDLTTAGTEFVSASGDINLVATEGNIRVGTYTNVFEETHIKEKSYLGGLLSKSSQLHTVDHINTGTDALAALDLSIVSGSDTTLVGATLSAGQNLNITTGGGLSVQAAIDSHRSEFFETEMGLVTMTTITETSFTETAVLTELLAVQGIDFDIGGDAELVLYQTAGVDAPNPQYLYPEELLAIDGLELISQELADEYFYEQKTQLSPAFKALVAIVVSAYVPGLGTSLGFAEGTFAVGSLNAFGNSVLLGSVDGVVSGEFDLGEILETASIQALSAGLTTAIDVSDLGINLGEGANGSLIPDFGSGQISVGGLLETGLDGVITSGINSAAYGTDFSDGVLNTVVSYVANGVAGSTIEEVSDVFGHSTIAFEKLVAKAAINCAAAEAKGASCGSGAVGSIVTDLAVMADAVTGPGGDPEEFKRQLEVASAVVGFFLSGGDAENVIATQSAALIDFDNNAGRSCIYLGNCPDYEVVSVFFGDDRAEALADLEAGIDAELANLNDENDPPRTYCSEKYGACVTTTKREQLTDLLETANGLNGLVPSNSDELSQELWLTIATLGAGKVATSVIDELIVAGKAAPSTADVTAGSIRDVNPTGGTQNCVNCSIATDNTLAGFPTSALPGNPTSVRVLEDHFGTTFQSVTGPQNITSIMTNAGDGARGIVFGSRGLNEVGHVFNVVNQNGTIRFLDGQTGTVANLNSGYVQFFFLPTN